MLIRSSVLLLMTVVFMTSLADEAELRIDTKSFVVTLDGLPTRSCHAATVVETAPGRLMAAWFGGSQEGASDVRIWGAHYEQGRWSNAVPLTESLMDGDEAHWNPVLFKTDNELVLHFKAGKSPRLWRGLYRTSIDKGLNWSGVQSHPAGFLGPVRNKPVSLPSGRLIYPSSTEHQGWRVHFERPLPQGSRRIEVGDPQMLGAIQPTILTHSDGRLQALCRTHSGVIAETWSLDNGDNWSELEPTELPNPNSGIDAITLGNGLHLLVYNPVIAGRTPLAIALSEDGVDWQLETVLEEGDGEFSYPAVIEDSGGKIHIVYTWQRKAIRHVQIDYKK